MAYRGHPRSPGQYLEIRGSVPKYYGILGVILVTWPRFRIARSVPKSPKYGLGVILVTWPRFRIARSVPKSPTYGLGVILAT
ncbi:hypothetical protein AVEN_73445-1 [Araneus ventricosus]|uniref:Uncharacterized protein n=1 Tax=Araneus ventricosus TaxID=182803 RepID=A0A4Y2GKV2_ARAVE|nr:hypothetical protein AVEN_73445-1 [Araneus ventricosus]